MLTIKASVKPSKIHGLGLFADERIPKGTIIWKFNPRFDIFFDPEEVSQMPPEQRALIDRYAYFSAAFDKYVYSIDDSRFTNHSSKHHNQDVVLMDGDIENCGVANRDIEKGEEILVNYRDFDAHNENGQEAYLDS